MSIIRRLMKSVGASSTAHRILLIEDDPSCNLVIQDYLRGCGFVVDGVRDGKWALQIVQQNPPDAIILDLGLMSMHGFEVLEELKRRGSEAPVVVITGRTDKETESKARGLGATCVLPKPVELRKLVAEIESL